MAEISRDSGSTVDWSAVPADVLRLIASKSSCVEHYLSFTSTCRWWRSTATDLEFSIRLNWLMPFSHRNDTDERVFCDVDTSKLHRLSLPEIRGATCFGSRFGYLVAVRDLKITLFDPISRASVPLPRLPVNVLRGGPFLKAVLTASPADPDCFVVVRHGTRDLTFAKPNDAVWSEIDLDPSFFIADFLFFDRRLYCLAYNGRVAVLDLSSPPPQPKSILAPPPLREHITRHLVEIGSALCMVVTIGGFAEIEIFKLVTTGPCPTWTRLDSLRNLCLILTDASRVFGNIHNAILSTVNTDEGDKLIAGCIYLSYFLGYEYSNPELASLGLFYYGEPIHTDIYYDRRIYYPTTSRDETPVWAVKSIYHPYYPTTSGHETPLWAWEHQRLKHVNLIPYSESCDAYTRLYPSLRFSTTVSVNVLIGLEKIWREKKNRISDYHRSTFTWLGETF